MPFTVVWLPAAEADLADLWLNSGDRDAITKAASEIDKLLRRDPENSGESREEGRRILLSRPLGVKFRTYSQDRMVQVVDVWRYITHSED
ncbi:MAG: hypothetical protein CMJ64_14675 [Planctomycetaceae bacterium]|nr:hypothetical protein [Planctomycetaceae bacterium]